MKYILILTFIFSNDQGRSGMGGAAVSQQEYNTLQACESAGDYWKKYHTKKNKMRVGESYEETWQAHHTCVPKGEDNER